MCRVSIERGALLRGALSLSGSVIHEFLPSSLCLRPSSYPAQPDTKPVACRSGNAYAAYVLAASLSLHFRLEDVSRLTRNPTLYASLTSEIAQMDSVLQLL